VFAEVTAVTGLRSIGTDERQALAEVSASPRAVGQVRSELTNIDFAGSSLISLHSFHYLLDWRDEMKWYRLVYRTAERPRRGMAS
jgi:hypothetical protein